MLVWTEKQLEALGERTAAWALRRYGVRSAARIFALTGELGSGKTTFLRGFARGLGIKRRIVSPTFVLARRYRIPPGRTPYARRRTAEASQRYGAAERPTTLWHVDAYRLRGVRDLAGIDFDGIVNNPQNIVAIEWADRIEKAIPNGTTWVFFQHHPKGRTVTVKPSKGRAKTQSANAD